MFIYKTIIILVMSLHELCQSLEWIPIGSPQLFQNHPKKQLKVRKPPVQFYELLQNRNLKQPGTKSFYKTSLSHFRLPYYEFRYKIHDPKENNYQEKSEVRTGDSVRGYYSVREPNGYIRLVKYVSNENGFEAEVSHHHHTEDSEGGYLFSLTRHIT